MPKIRKFANLSNLNDPTQFMRHGSQAIGDAVDTINGALEFDSNLATKSVSVTFKTANTNTMVTHNLGKIPTGFMTSMPTAACTVFLGTGPIDENIIYLQSTAPATVLLIFH